MGNNTTSTHKIIVTDGGTLQETTASSKKLNNELEKVAKNSKSATEALKRTGPSPESRMYDQARAGRGTGAEGRDFANQAQGLGGLVRVYATFAANLFAVSAAFNALSRAADTTNMVKGLDQLGAASGRNLGGLSKQVVEATGNAISLKEAMTSVAMSTAAGMSSKDLLRLSAGAAKVSQTLGVDMSDAMSRLTRGITKLEPELLDELGIFVRVDKASQEYAKSIGKSALALTDFEKRAAFSSAVLKQLEDKFGNIKVDANPYNTLLATLKNVMSAGLELVNKVLGPLIGALASSPTALTVVLAGIGAVLLKQAIPAITSFRQSMRDAAEEATRKARDITETFDAVKSGNFERMKARLSDQVKAQARAAEDMVKVAQDKINKGLKLGGGPINSIAKTDILSISKTQIDAAEKSASRYEKLASGANKLTDAERALNMEKAKSLRQSIEAIRAAQQLDSISRKSQEDELTRMQKKAGMFTHEGQITAIQDRLVKSSAKSNIVANAADNAATLGMANAWAVMKSEIDASEAKLNKFDRAMLKARGGLAIFSSAAMTAVSAFSGWLMIIGLIVTGVTMLVNALRKNSAEAEATASAISSLDDASKAATRTFDLMSKRDPLEFLSVDSIGARATAIYELSNSITAAYDAANKEIAARNWMDSLVNDMASIFGKDTETQLRNSIGKGVSEAIRLAYQSAEVTSEVKALQKAIGTTSTDTEEITNRVKKLDNTTLSNIVKQVENIGKESKKAHAQVKELNDGFSQSAKDLQEYLASLTSSDPLTKIARGMVTNSIALEKALQDPVKSLDALVTIATDVNKLSLFPPETAAGLVSYGAKLKVMQEELGKSRQKAQALRDEITSLNRQAIQAEATAGTYNEYGTIDPNQADAAALLREAAAQKANELTQLQATEAKLRSTIINTSTVFKTAAEAAFIAGSKQIESRIASGFAQAALTVQKAYSNLLSGTTAGIKDQARLDKATIDLQNASLATTLNLIKSQEELRIAIENNSLETERARVSMMEPGTARNAEFARLDTKAEELKVQRDFINTGGNAFKALNALPLNIRQALLPFTEKMMSTRAQMAQVGAQKAAIDISSSAQVKEKEAKESNARQAARDTDALNLEKAVLAVRKEGKKITDLEAVTMTAELDAKQRSIEFTKQERDIRAEIEKANTVIAKTTDKKQKQLAEEAKVELEKRITDLTERKNAADNVAKTQTTGAEDTAKRAQADKEYALNQEVIRNTKSATLDIELESLKASQDILNYDRETGFMTEAEYNSRSQNLQLRVLEVNAAKERNRLEDEYNDKMRKLKEDKVGASPERLREISAEENNLNIIRTNGINVLNAQTKAQADNIKLNTQQIEAQKLFKTNMESINQAIADSLIEMTQGVNREWSKMFEKMIMDAANAEIKLSMMEFGKGVMKSMGISSFFGANGGLFGSGGANLLGGLFGGGASGGIPSGMGPETLALFGYRNGGAFTNNGIQMFAKGGGFTNSIVDSPTLFKFAKGTGMMGEAGPEAIMPLKRDAKGNLGVVNTNNDNSSSTRTVNVSNNFTISGPVDKRTQQQIATAAAKGAQLALLRNG